MPALFDELGHQASEVLAGIFNVPHWERPTDVRQSPVGIERVG
jgi:hypothetical protein